MAKRRSKKKQAISPEEREQRQALKNLCDELTDLQDISLTIMFEKGILPPLYGGDHLGEDREVIPLWGYKIEDADPELGALLLRVMPGVEPDPDLEMTRDELGLENEWPLAELFDMMKLPDGSSAIEGSDELRDLSVLFVLMGEQVRPAPGYDRDTMITFMSEMRPFAVFPIIPTTGKDDDLTYQWERLEDFRAEVVYADSPQLLEAAVWEYRLNCALAEEVDWLKVEGKDPAEELMAQDTAELSALYNVVVLRSLHLYGTTSPIRARQEELDILREENGDLIVKAPLRPEVEPIPLLAEDRQDLEGGKDGVILHLIGGSPMMQQVWPRIRAKRFFCLRLRYGALVEKPGGGLEAKGFTSSPVFEWYASDMLPDLYRQVRLASIYEMLASCDLIAGRTYQIDNPEYPNGT
jgi:hypothetical protein